MIKEVFLFTNRNILVLDENGEQLFDIQGGIGWKKQWDERGTIQKILADSPKFYIADFQDNWCKKIDAARFCALLGYGKEYIEKWKEQIK